MYLKKSAYSLAIYLSISIFPGLMVIRDIINHILGHGMLAEEKIMIITPNASPRKTIGNRTGNEL